MAGWMSWNWTDWAARYGPKAPALYRLVWMGRPLVRNCLTTWIGSKKRRKNMTNMLLYGSAPIHGVSWPALPFVARSLLLLRVQSRRPSTLSSLGAWGQRRGVLYLDARNRWHVSNDLWKFVRRRLIRVSVSEDGFVVVVGKRQKSKHEEKNVTGNCPNVWPARDYWSRSFSAPAVAKSTRPAWWVRILMYMPLVPLFTSKRAL